MACQPQPHTHTHPTHTHHTRARSPSGPTHPSCDTCAPPSRAVPPAKQEAGRTGLRPPNKKTTVVQFSPKPPTTPRGCVTKQAAPRTHHHPHQENAELAFQGASGAEGNPATPHHRPIHQPCPFFPSLLTRTKRRRQRARGMWSRSRTNGRNIHHQVCMRRAPSSSLLAHRAGRAPRRALGRGPWVGRTEPQPRTSYKTCPVPPSLLPQAQRLFSKLSERATKVPRAWGTKQLQFDP